MPVDPEAALIADEEQKAIRDALRGLDVDERDGSWPMRWTRSPQPILPTRPG